jgi:predicted ATP-dependent endonuclease of OLD family
MPKLFHIHIENFRGLQCFDHTFTDGLTCIIGRGDSGKSTILEAISYVLSSSYTLQFNDGDFYNCDVSRPIIIEATLKDLSEEILRKVGNHIRGIKDGKIIESMLDEDAIEAEDAVTIRLRVQKDLEPEWTILGASGTEPRPIRSNERELFNCFYISDYNDRHFTLSKGTPLNSLFKQKADKKPEILNAELIADLGRSVKIGFNEAIQAQEVFDDVFNAISQNATLLGLSAGDVKASIDQKEFLLRENKIALHRDDIPMRQLGKGSKRLLSLAIQLSLTEPSGIILIDEIEQGLEPDRVQHIVSTLKKRTGLQVILTTHSSNAIVELTCSDIHILRKPFNVLINIPATDEMQGTIRKNPEAFFAKRVLVCEGATEVGIIRGLNEYALRRTGRGLSNLGIRYADGAGKNLINYVPQFAQLGYEVCVFCDSDASDVNAKKDEFMASGITIADCSENMAIEQQLFNDLSWDSVIKLIEYHLDDFGQDSKVFYESIKNNLTQDYQYADDWWRKESTLLRKAFGDKAKADAKKGGAWYKNIEHGEFIASVILNDLRNLDKSSRLFKIIKVLVRWILAAT